MCAMCDGAARAAQRCIALGYFMPVRKLHAGNQLSQRAMEGALQHTTGTAGR